MRLARVLPAILAVFLLLGALPSQAQTAAVGPGTTGLKLPRFVSVKARAGEVNLRTGPGTRYPVEWVLMRPRWPLEVIAEYEAWRQVRARDGTTGWVHHTMLSGDRMAIVAAARIELRREPSAGAATVAMAEDGAVTELRECEGKWCLLSAAGVAGWAPRDALWGVYPDEDVK
ncbi:MAG: hypothetical protein EXQ97_04095 [Alphaproteobacteria bacterium]|nr:hypothetical protein [Alphaproteobacteria bacterium]